jgi:hypothetical protein
MPDETRVVKRQIFEWLCHHYYRNGRQNDFIEIDFVRESTGIAEDLLNNALTEFVYIHGQMYVEAYKTKIRLGSAGIEACEKRMNPFS